MALEAEEDEDGRGAAMTEPAAITFHCETYWPCRLISDAVIGMCVSVRSTLIAHSRSLKIQVKDRALSAASAGRASGSTIRQ